MSWREVSAFIRENIVAVHWGWRLWIGFLRINSCKHCNRCKPATRQPMRLQHMISHLAYKRSGLSRAGRPGRPLPTLLQCRHYRLQADAPVPHCDNTTELVARHFRRDQATRDKRRRAAATLPVDRPHTTAAETHHSVAAYPTCCTALGNTKTCRQLRQRAPIASFVASQWII